MKPCEGFTASGAEAAVGVIHGSDKFRMVPSFIGRAQAAVRFERSLPARAILAGVYKARDTTACQSRKIAGEEFDELCIPLG